MIPLEKQRVFAARMVVGLALALLIGYAILALLAARDRIDRPRLEQLNEQPVQPTPGSTPTGAP